MVILDLLAYRSSSVLTNENHNENISTKLDDLTHTINQLLQSLRSEPQAGTSGTAMLDNDCRVMNHLEDCVLSAEQIVSRASSIGGTRSTVFGPFSDGLGRVYDWIPDPAETQHQTHFGENATSSPAVTSATRSAPPNPAGDDSDSESDFHTAFEAELIENWRTSGIRKFQLALYADAQSDFERVLERSQINYNSFYAWRLEVMEMLAIAYYRQGKWDAAEKLLLQFNSGKDPKALKTVHALAGVYFGKKDFDKAEKFCKRAIAGRKRALGEDHASYFLSIALLVRIYEEQDNRKEAEAWNRFLPSKSWMEEIQGIEQLRCLSPSDAAAMVGREFLKDFLRDDGQSEEKWQEIRANIKNCKGGLSGSGYGYNLLHAAAEHGHELGVCLLLEDGPKIDSRDLDGNTALHLAAQNHTRIVQLLLQVKPNVNAKSKTGRTPLIVAAENNMSDTARLLVDNGADVRVKDDFEWTALHYASTAGAHTIVQLLLESHADVGVKGSGGWTPLHCAARHGRDTVVGILIVNGANVKAKCLRKQTALDLAQKHGHANIVELLQRASSTQKNELVKGVRM